MYFPELYIVQPILKYDNGEENNHYIWILLHEYILVNDSWYGVTHISPIDMHMLTGVTTCTGVL